MDIPVIGLGTWKLRGEECERVVREAIELGYRHIDTADAYENHREIGKAIGPSARPQIFITSKLWMDQLEPKGVEGTLNRFLEELRTDYLDLLLIHWPNPAVNLAETLQAMAAVQKKGLVRFIGVSNFVRSNLEALRPFHFPIYNNQIELHPYFQRRLLVEKCKEMKIKVTAYRPLGKGAFEEDAVIQKIGKNVGKSPSQVVLRWMIQHEFIAIPKASSEQHLKENINIFDFQLSDHEMELIDGLDHGVRYCAPDGLPVLED